MKQLGLFLISIIYCSIIFSITKGSNTSLEVTKKKAQDGILWAGWLKYFHYENSNLESKPTQFFINQEYKTQKVLTHKLANKDKLGKYTNIPTRFHFYAKLLDNTNSFNILSSRNAEIRKTVDVLNINLIKNLPMDDAYSSSKSSSIRDLGNFSEGNCISVATLVPEHPNEKFDINDNENSKSGKSENWVFCLDDKKTKDELFGFLIQKKIKIQKDYDQTQEANRIDSVNKSTNMSNILAPKNSPNMEKYTGPGASANDGYLILLQDWSQCSVKCGGGFRYQQWMCIPPKKGGRPCKGDLIRKLPCNKQSCPGTQITSQSTQKHNDPEPVTKNPIIKSLPISNRPQQNIKCEIRENDVLVNQNFPGIPKPVNTPARLVMNIRTISIFTDEDYKDALFNFDLKKTELYPVSSDICCFILKSENKSYKICAFGQDCGNKLNPYFFNDWKFSFNLFKNKCYDNLEKENASKSIGILPQKGQNDNNSLQMDLAEDTVNEREKLIRKKLDDSVENLLEREVETTQKYALKAIKKELNLEEMIKKEEIMKAKEEASELVQLMKHEQKKKERLEQALRERQLESMRMREVKEVKTQIAKIQLEAQQKVQDKRTELKTKLLEIRKNIARRKRIIEHQINMIRGQMAKDLILANKEGNMNNCSENKNDQNKINNYCNTNIVDDYSKNIECKSLTSFCYICCENEFGSMYISMRDDCYNMCDNSLNAELKNSGEFIWN